MLLYLLFAVVSVVFSSDTDEPHAGCFNHGLCSVQTNGTCPSSKCVCNEGTSGFRCGTVEKKCNPDPCFSFGPNYDCVEGISNYTCICASGYTGDDCETDLTSPCLSSPCLNGGTCSVNNISNTYSCECDGYTGTRCEYEDWCASSPCQNGGTCEVLWDGAAFKCKCNSDYQGLYCQDSTASWKNFQNQGCYDWSDDLKVHYEVITDSAMTFSKCKKLAQDVTKPYLMFTVSGQDCMLSNTSYLNTTTVYGALAVLCWQGCPGNDEQYCGTSNVRALWGTWDEIKIDPMECDVSLSANTCNRATNDQGVCVDTLSSDSSGHRCICRPPYQQTGCGTALDPCESDPCDRGTCIPDVVAESYTCDCPYGYAGKNCQYRLQCASNPCLYGGTCVENYDGTYSCECLEYFHGEDCESADICEFANPCGNGTCVGLGGDIKQLYRCDCAAGFTGTDCDTETNECDPTPCGFGSPCTDLYLNYTCDCIEGITGRDCNTNINDCVLFVDEAGNPHPNRCVTRDKDAVCVDLVNGFQCNCSSQWTEEYCDMNIIIKEVLTLVFGEDGDYALMIPLLEDLMNNPAQIKDMVPFMIGQKTYEERSNLSWTADDLFLWATFEEKPLDLQKDLTRWNDVVLGNCFTFNHRDVATVYDMRGPGKEGGFQTLMNIRSEEFQPWFDTAAIMVFVHNPDENIFSESVRYNAEPGGHSELHVSDTRFTRLDGKYGTCVVDPSEVAAYYYEGMYTTDGCLRSCYQDMIQTACECMDPRYPFPDEYNACQVTDMTCVEEATEKEGDPSTWESCVCPLPCENQQYSVTWSRSNYVTKPAACTGAGSWNPLCLANNTDTVLISIVLPVLNYKTYAEEPSMDLNRFISNLGGLLGVLMGVGIVWFIEVVFLVFRIGNVLIT